VTGTARPLRAFRSVLSAVREALAETRLAYEFNPNSYSFSAMNACMRGERALEVLQNALEDSFSDLDDHL
jgi:hypothetical protein